MKSLISPFSGAVAAGTLGFVALAWIVIMGQLQSLGKLQFESEQRQQQVMQSRPSGSARNQEEQLQKTKEQAEILLPVSDDQYDLSVQVEGLSKSVGVSLGSLSLTADTKVTAKAAPAAEESTGAKTAATPAASAAPAAPASALKKITVTMSASGTYDQLQRFVDGLTTIDRFIQVDQVTMTMGATGDTMSSQIIAFAYYLPAAK